MFKRFFEDELEYLRELSLEFAAVHPEPTAELDLLGRDPEVGRLFQGFAFLTARVREQLEGGYPELLHPLLERVWPFALRPTPAVGLVQFEPRAGVLRQVYRLKRHALLLSRPIDGVQCQFRTTAALPIFPLRPCGLEVETPTASTTRLTLRLELLSSATLAGIDGAPLRLHLQGPEALRYGLFSGLTRRLEAIRVRAQVGPDLETVAERRLPPGALSPGGWEVEEALLPSASPAVLAQRHLHELLILPEKFLCVDLRGLDWLAGVPDLRRIEVVLELAGEPGSLAGLALDHLKLHCVPVVNLCPHKARPLAAEAHRAEYRVRPEGDRPDHFDLFSIEGVRGSRRSGLQFQPWFGYGPRAGDGEAPGVFYRVRLQPAVAFRPGDAEERARRPGVEHYLSFVDGRGQPFEVPSSVRVELLATNGDLPRRMRPEELCVSSRDVESFLSFRGIGSFTQPAPALLEPEGLWRCATYLRRGWRIATSREALRAALYYYHRAGVLEGRSRQRLEALLKAIARLEVELEQHVLGIPPAVVYGRHIRLEAHERHFSHPGELQLFGEVLHRFLVETTVRSTCTRLTIVGLDEGEAWAWPVTAGKQGLV